MRDSVTESIQVRPRFAKDLSHKLNVSEDTVRRDLREMDAKGLILRVHGGAFPVNSMSLLFSDRQEESLEQKRLLARTGKELIKQGKVILIDGSTTNLQLAKEIPLDLHATIITNSPVICVELSNHPNLDIMMLGGKFLKDSLVNIGTTVIDTLVDIKADLCFLGTYSLHPEFGISVPNFEESLVKKQMIRSSRKVAILLTTNKLNTISNYSVGSLSDLDYLIVEDGVPQSTINQYEQWDIEIIHVAI
ncbi:DeoR/GlpR transcriptional regulator [Bacillus sp. HNG]|uniref:DeoR/GlpR family DNA-binding transcription regulator n=1 Tax=Bacillus sp. HNG TaxID=2293325 RepID=UPI000E2E63EA|nr:DeoR/GlpR family DNA-binding transcription regulator [Bacillus sp. HNG]RFB12631.1 DeoR/GlpR transcriptional regulator [Bacillus sp. HNG]